MSMALVEDNWVETRVVVATKDQIGCNLGGEEVVLDLSSGVYYGLNSVASRVWALVQKPIAVGEIIETILAEYDVDKAECEDAVRKLLAEMREHGLVEEKP
jgi:hypothetical protein